ncbi:hypothetical protein G6F56_008716 [Rhizopus delemar]|nr:hypothetical protein G6F56_008716 [Rhizopus delemar]
MTICSVCLSSFANSRFKTCDNCREQRRLAKRRQNNEPPRQRGRKKQLPAAHISQLSRIKALDLGRMDQVCEDCGTKHWKGELPSNSTRNNKFWMSYCRAGAVKLDLLQEPPAYLQNLFLGAGAEERAFRNALRRYNSAFAFTSVGCDQPENSTNRNLMPFQVHGEMYHLQEPLASGPHNDARYSQLYIYDPEYAANLRCTTNSDLNRDIIENLTREINECNPHVALYKSVHELLENYQESSVVISPSLNLRLIEGNDRRTENLPTSNEIAAIIPTSADANTDGIWGGVGT